MGREIQGRGRQTVTERVYPTHPLCDQFVLLPSGRRFLMPRAKKNIYKIYFVPVGFINQKV